MTTRSTSTESQPATWQRKGIDWHLVAAGQTYARVDRDGRRWLCYVVDDGENEHFLGQARSLASGKAHLSLHYAPRSRFQVYADDVAPL